MWQIELWMCCHCGSGPNVYDLLNFCAACGHVSCDVCSFEKSHEGWCKEKVTENNNQVYSSSVELKRSDAILSNGDILTIRSKAGMEEKVGDDTTSTAVFPGDLKITEDKFSPKDGKPESLHDWKLVNVSDDTIGEGDYDLADPCIESIDDCDGDDDNDKDYDDEDEDEDDDSEVDSKGNALLALSLISKPVGRHSAISRTLQYSVRNMVENIIQSDYFDSIVDSLLAGIKTHTEGSAASSTGNNDRGVNYCASSNVSGTPGIRKRQTRGSGPNGPEGGDDGDDSDDTDRRRDKDPKRRRCAPYRRRRLPKEFACPFLKFDPGFFKDVRACTKEGWPSTHRLKEHLYRRHTLFQCGRCNEAFQSLDGLKRHARQVASCEIQEQQPNHPRDGINEEQIKKLRSREGLKGLSEEDRWRRIYLIISRVGETASTPSPYFDKDEDDGVSPLRPLLEQSVRDRLVDCIKSKLDGLIGSEVDKLRDKINSQLRDIVSTSLKEVLSSNHDFVEISPGQLSLLSMEENQSSMNQDIPHVDAPLDPMIFGPNFWQFEEDGAEVNQRWNSNESGLDYGGFNAEHETSHIPSLNPSEFLPASVHSAPHDSDTFYKNLESGSTGASTLNPATKPCNHSSLDNRSSLDVGDEALNILETSLEADLDGTTPWWMED